MAMAALMLAATTVTADPMRDGEPVLTGKIDRFDCQQTLRALTEPDGLSDELQVEYAKKNNGYKLIATEVRWSVNREKCVIDWYRETDVFSTMLYLKEVRADERNWDDIDWQSKEGARLIMRELDEHQKDSPEDMILKPVLKHISNVEVRVMTMFDAFQYRKWAPGAANRYYSKNF